MTLLHAGAVLDRAPGPKYLAALDFAEISLRDPLPKPATIAGWRGSFPAELTTSLVVPPAARGSGTGPLRFDDAMEKAFAWTVEAAAALGARFVVLPTGGELTTGQRDRDLLAAWIERFGQKDRRIVWHPSGLWEAEHAQPFAAKLGVILAFDPLEEEEPPSEEPAYARLRAVGMRTRFNESLLMAVAEVLEGREAYVAIESPSSFREASKLAELAAAEE
jgi:hypothetical protein